MDRSALVKNPLELRPFIAVWSVAAWLVTLLTGCGENVDIPVDAVVPAAAETEAVSSRGDAADDPAIWVHPREPARSRILGTDKKHGLMVYDLDGKQVQDLPVGRLNNVDIRQSVAWGGADVDLAVATNRTTRTLDVFSIDRRTGHVHAAPTAQIALELNEPYGLCLYHDISAAEVYVFVNDKDGRYEQWRLDESLAAGAERVREFRVASQPEGCVVDDALGTLYYGEEAHGIWRVPAAAGATAAPQLVDGVDGSHLTADVEGLSLYIDGPRSGFLVASSQGSNSYVLYDRLDNRYRGSFRIGDNADSNVDGTSETDGLDARSDALGERYPRGLLVVQDGANGDPSSTQNFKLVDWREIERRFPTAGPTPPAAR